MFNPVGQGAQSIQPMVLNNLVSETIRIYQKHFVNFIGIFVVVQLIVTLFGLLTGALAVSGAIPLALLGTAITVLVSIVGYAIQSGATTLVVADDMVGQQVTMQGVLNGALAKLSPLIITSLIIGVICGVLFVTVIGIPFAIWLAVRWVFSTAVVMLEGPTQMQAMSRSSALVQGSWWRTFGIIILTAIVIAIVGAIIGAIFGGIPVVGFIIKLLYNIVSTPLLSIVITLMYFDSRVRKENLTPQTIRPSGM